VKTFSQESSSQGANPSLLNPNPLFQFISFEILNELLHVEKLEKLLKQNLEVKNGKENLHQQSVLIRDRIDKRDSCFSLPF
jgi:hypothetical protein